MTYCTRCGSEIADGARFCTACGEPVSAVEPPLTFDGDSSSVPYFVIQAMEALDSIKLSSYMYFQDAVARVPPFRRVEVVLRKQTRANVPDGWEVERGGVVVLHDGEMIGKLPPEKVEGHGLSTSRKHHAFVIPPCVDADEGFRINDNYVPHLLL